jgi:SAM-dependent methyltransferase
MEKQYSATYHELWNSHWWWRSRHRIVMGEVRNLLSRRREEGEMLRILDIGCAGGVAFQDLSEFGDVSGLEPDAGLIQDSPWLDRIECQEFGRDYTSEFKYDLVLMLDVLEHIHDDVDAAASLCGLLRPGGHAILTVPALPSLWSVHDEANHHHRRYTHRSLRCCLETAGLAIVSLRHFSFWALGPMYLRKFVPRKDASNYTVSTPWWPINLACDAISRIEWLLSSTFRVQPPCGSSLLTICSQPNPGTNGAQNDASDVIAASLP